MPDGRTRERASLLLREVVDDLVQPSLSLTVHTLLTASCCCAGACLRTVLSPGFSL